jgi:SagB-type dehydrogenase family enzyme
VVTGTYPLEQLIKQRRSVRDFDPASLTLAETGQLLWSAQGVTDNRSLRAAPSAGALYPLELYVVAGRVAGLDPGIYHYAAESHQLVKTVDGDLRRALSGTALSQNWMCDAAMMIVFTANYQRTMSKYGSRGRRYVHIEAGHAAQNLYLQAQALGLATVVVGAFVDDDVARVLSLPGAHQPVLLMPVGRSR